MSDYRGIGVLGGSFNPVHKGHVFLAEYVRETCRLEKVLMIPTGVHPFSTKRKNVPPGIHRLNMIKLAIENAPGVEASDFTKYTFLYFLQAIFMRLSAMCILAISLS